MGKLSGLNDMRVHPREKDNAFGRLSVGLSRVCRTRRSGPSSDGWRRVASIPHSSSIRGSVVRHPSLTYTRARSRPAPALFHSGWYKVTPRDRQFLARIQTRADSAIRAAREWIICYSRFSLYQFPSPPPRLSSFLLAREMTQ